MAAHFVQFQNVPTGDGTSDAIVSRAYRDKWVQVEGTFTASVQIQGRMKGATGWENLLGSALTAPGMAQVTQTVEELRVSISSHTAGTPAVYLGAFIEYGMT